MASGEPTFEAALWRLSLATLAAATILSAVIFWRLRRG